MRFTPLTKERRRIERPFGVHFSSEDYQQLTGIVDRYFGMQPFEIAAPFLDPAKSYLKDLRTRAEAFQKSLQPPASHPEAAFYVQRLIIEEFQKGKQSGPDRWNEIVMSMFDFIAASDRAEMVLYRRMKGGGFVEGDAWRSLICDLTKFCEKKSFPTGAAKGLNKGDVPSPFVAFVYELQGAFPEKFRRFNFSYAALATAIAGARPSKRERKSGTTRI